MTYRLVLFNRAVAALMSATDQSGRGQKRCENAGGPGSLLASLKPEAVFEVPGSPDWLAVGDSVWVSDLPKNAVLRFDPKTNKVAATITVGAEAMASGLARAGFLVQLVGSQLRR